MDIDYLVDRLEALITAGKRVPLSNKVMVDEQECLDLIDQMRAVVPEEVKAAKRTLLDRERILNDAEEDARQLLEHAEQERDIMISREGLMAEAERRRDEMLNEAAQESYDLRGQAQGLYDEAVLQTQEMREGANSYTMQVLQELENLLGKHITMVRNGLQSFQQQAQHYQEQIEEYQRQNRVNYSPPQPPVEPRPVPSRTTALRGSPVSPTAASSSSRSPAISPTERIERKPNPVASNNPTQVERKPIVPSSYAASAAERRSNSSPNSSPNSNGSSPARNVSPVPKPNRSGEPAEEPDELNDDEFLNPRNNTNAPVRRPGTNRPNDRGLPPF